MVTTKKVDEHINIIVLGAPAAGKKNFIRRYCNDIFSDLYDPLTEITREQRSAIIRNTHCSITLERVPTLCITQADEAARIARSADALMFLYDGTSATGAAEAERLYGVVRAYLEEDVPRAVVVTKADAAGEGWEAAMEAGRSVAEGVGGSFCVTSALWGDGVRDAVEGVVVKVLERRGR